MMLHPLQSLVALLLLSISGLAQQALPAIEVGEVAGPETLKLGYFVQLPAAFAADQWRPVVVLLAGATADAAADRQQAERLAAAIAQHGLVVVCPQAVFHTPIVCGPGPEASLSHPALSRLPTVVRQRFRIAQGGMHLVATGTGVALATKLAIGQPWEFQTLSLFGGESGPGPGDEVRLHGRRVAWFVDAPAGTAGSGATPNSVARPTEGLRRPAVPNDKLAEFLPAHLVALHAEREPGGIGSELSRVLDDFHDAAAKGDEDRYFALLPEDSVFLGTDATERWTGTEFRAFAMPYFERGPAWTYVPVSRHVTVGPNGAMAWFDEVLDNEAYGECRGSGVLQLRDGAWVVRQYNLTIPVPNDLARGLVDRVRALASGRGPAVTTVVVVRHAEKGDGDDPDLTDAGKARSAKLQEALAALPVTAVYASEWKRTQATVEPLCRSKGLAPQVATAKDAKGLAARIRKEHAGGTVVVAGHSNTVPVLLKALGVVEPVQLTEEDYGELFVVVMSVDGAKLLRLRY